MSEPTDEEIESQRAAGEVTLVLETATPERRASLLRVIAHLCGQERAEELAAQFPPQDA